MVVVRVWWGVGCSATLVAGEAAMASEAGAACPAAAAAGAGYTSRWRGSRSWSHPDEDNNVYNRAKEEAWAQYQREYDAATAVSGSVAAAAASGAVQ